MPRAAGIPEHTETIDRLERDIMTEEKNKKEGTADGIMEWVKDILIALVIATIIIQFIKPTIVKESSMEPNFYSNDYLFINKMAYKFGHTPERGDVIVFHSELTTESGKKKLLIKRVIGLPGDKITVEDGQVYINGKEDDMSYTNDGYTPGEIQDQEVPNGCLFCMGDNRVVSVDSRDPSVGYVDQGDVVGRVFVRLYPFNKIGFIKNPYQ